MLGAHDDLRGCGLGPTLRLHREPVLLQLQEPRGGNGTARASGKTGVAYCVVDKDGQAGYLTAKA